MPVAQQTNSFHTRHLPLRRQILHIFTFSSVVSTSIRSNRVVFFIDHHRCCFGDRLLFLVIGTHSVMRRLKKRNTTQKRQHHHNTFLSSFIVFSTFPGLMSFVLFFNTIILSTVLFALILLLYLLAFVYGSFWEILFRIQPSFYILTSQNIHISLYYN